MSATASRTVQFVLFVVISICAVCHGEVYYVALDGNNTNGQTWADAFTSIGTALAEAPVVAGDVIRVKQGTYPISSPIVVNKAIKIYGGYSGDGEMRNAAVYATIIDGGDIAIHCFHVVADATIDGLRIVRGCAFGDVPNNQGGGMYIANCRPTISNCTFSGNHAEYCGGAIYAKEVYVGTIDGCTFLDNTASDQGGGIYSYDSNLTITNCSFTQNRAESGLTTRGGAIYSKSSDPTITECAFTGNGATNGAGIYNDSSNAVIAECTFAGCTLSSNCGGGVYNYGSFATIKDCLFYGNDVVGSGAAMYETNMSGSTVVNCIMRNNSAVIHGGAIYTGTQTTTRFTNCTVYANSAASQGGGLYNNRGEPRFTNCIFWDNAAPMGGAAIYDYSPAPGFTAVVRYSDVQGDSVYPGMGNILGGPNFANPIGDDLHLTLGSPCIDAGDNYAPGIPVEDFEGNTRVVDGDLNGTPAVDMGAYEYQGAWVGIAAHVKRIEVFQGLLYETPGSTTPSYLFMLSLDTDDTIDHIEFLTPAGCTFTIPNDPHTSSGGVETYHADWGATHRWEYWGWFDNAAALTSYADGTYLIAIHHHNAAAQQTSVWYGLPGTSDPVPQPTQKPNLTFPPYDVGIASPVTFAWDACTDPAADCVFVGIVDPSTGENVVEDDIDVNATSSDAYSLDEGSYRVEFALERSCQVTNVDGIPFEYGKASVVLSEFEVLYTNVYRFWCGARGRHFYTISESEKKKLINNYSHIWAYEGSVFKACATEYYPGLTAVYRFWSPVSGAHFYTIKESEKDKLVSQYSHVWTYEGPVLYAYPEGQQPADARPIYRFWKRADNTHFYTMSDSEKDKLIHNFPLVYTFEGTAFYAYE